MIRRAVRCAALGLGLLAGAGPALALRPLDSVEPPDVLTLPETVRGTVQVPAKGLPADAGPAGRVDTLRAIFPALAACWSAPAGIEAGEVTLRLSLRRDGSVQGAPRVTFASPAAGSRDRRALVGSALDAVGRCTPLALTAGLGGAVAGRPLAIRFIFQPQDRERPRP